MSYTILTVMGVILLGGSFGMNMIYLASDMQGANRTGLQVGSTAINTCVVAYLIFNIIYYRPYTEQWIMFLAGIVLVAGFMFEIYFTVIPLDNVGSGFAYAVAVLNAIARLYILIGIRCSSAQSTIPGLVGEVVKAVKPAVEASKNVGRELGTMDLQNIYSRIVGSPGIQRWFRELNEDERADQKMHLKQALGLEAKPPRE
jgi:hypothetical protein